MRALLISTLLAIALTACKQGSPLPNLPPNTTISISQINLTGPDRLTSEVTLHWSGSDQDGWVTGFEISNNQLDWDFVTVQDSTFNFDIAGGLDSVDIDFWVRAIDNDDEEDLSPAYLNIPIKNSDPLVRFDSTRALNDTSFVVTTMFWNSSDPDGDETLDSVFIKVNNGAWFPMDVEINVLTLMPETPTGTGSMNSDAYKNIDPELLPNQVEGIRLNDDNQVYIKVRDVAGSWSAIDSSKIFFVKNKVNDLLIVDTHQGGGTVEPEAVYIPIMNNLGIAFDYFDLESNNGANIPPLWNPTFSLYLNLYDKVFWYADAATVDGTQLYLEAAASAISEYLNNDGKMLITAQFPTDFDNTSPIIGFSPMDSLSTATGQARFPTDSLMAPSGSFAGAFDTLQSSAFITGADPFYMKASADAMFTADITKIGAWVGTDIVCARTTNANSQTNQVFVSLELHLINGRPAALENFFNQVLNNEFNW